MPMAFVPSGDEGDEPACALPLAGRHQRRRDRSFRRSADFDRDPALANVTVFEPKQNVRVLELHNELRIHTWGDALCCLAKDATSLFFTATMQGPRCGPILRAGEYLLLEEVRSPTTGLTADADPKASPGAADRQASRSPKMLLSPRRARRHMLTPRTNPADPAFTAAAGRIRQGRGAGFPALRFAEDGRSTCRSIR